MYTYIIFLGAQSPSEWAKDAASHPPMHKTALQTNHSTQDGHDAGGGKGGLSHTIRNLSRKMCSETNWRLLGPNFKSNSSQPLTVTSLVKMARGDVAAPSWGPHQRDKEGQLKMRTLKKLTKSHQLAFYPALNFKIFFLKILSCYVAQAGLMSLLSAWV